MNRWQLESMRGGIAQELEKASKTLTELYGNTASTMDERDTQKRAVSDLKERLEGVNNQITEMDEAVSRKMRTQPVETDTVNGRVKSKAAIYRATMRKEPVPEEHYKALADGSSSGGEKFLPKTVANEIITEPTVTNPLRGLSTFTNITNLELPRIAFSLDDDEFIANGETAKELKQVGSSVQFERNKFKVFADVSETVLLGTDTNLVSVIDRALESGLAKKERKCAFDQSPGDTYKHMSFYAKDGENYLTKATACPVGTSLYKAILSAIADLEEDYRENATVMMRYADYLDLLELLANGSTSLYGVQPSQVVGKPVVFCDLAKIPVVGDFSYSHYNYDIGMQYEHDKNIKTGMESFVLTAWFDHQIKLRSAFRLATVLSSQ